MSKLFFLFLILSTSLPVLSQVSFKNSSQKKVFFERLKQFELTDYYNKGIIKYLDYELEEIYFEDIQKVLGCHKGSCVHKKSKQIYYQDLDDKVCLPSTNCEFYTCMEEKYQCSQVGNDYFKKFAHPACSRYMKNINQKMFTQKGFNWIFNVMICLQKTLVDECVLNNNCEGHSQKEICDKMSESTVGFHPYCYTQVDGGICKLPLKDQIAVWKTVKPFLTSDHLKEAFRVILSCIKN